jgi:prefoldin subunit 5
MNRPEEETGSTPGALALEGIEMLHKKVENLEERIDRLTQQMADLEARIHEEVE